MIRFLYISLAALFMTGCLTEKMDKSAIVAGSLVEDPFGYSKGREQHDEEYAAFLKKYLDERKEYDISKYISKLRVGPNKIYLGNGNFNYTEYGHAFSSTASGKQELVHVIGTEHSVKFNVLNYDRKTRSLELGGVVTDSNAGMPRKSVRVVIGTENVTQREFKIRISEITDNQGKFNISVKLAKADRLFFCQKGLPIAEYAIGELDLYQIINTGTFTEPHQKSD